MWVAALLPLGGGEGNLGSAQPSLRFLERGSSPSLRPQNPLSWISKRDLANAKLAEILSPPQGGRRCVPRYQARAAIPFSPLAGETQISGLAFAKPLDLQRGGLASSAAAKTPSLDFQGRLGCAKLAEILLPRRGGEGDRRTREWTWDTPSPPLRGRRKSWFGAAEH